MTAESILGLDHLKRRSSNASETHIAAKIGFSDNGTSDWLEKIGNSTIYHALVTQGVTGSREPKTPKKFEKKYQDV